MLEWSTMALSIGQLINPSKLSHVVENLTECPDLSSELIILLFMSL